MLIQIILFIFMLMGVMALYIDLGLARLTQSQMQNAADVAALEGLRGCAPNDSVCLASPDIGRRNNANMILAPSSGLPGLSAGPPALIHPCNPTDSQCAELQSLDNIELQPSRQLLDLQSAQAVPPAASLQTNLVVGSENEQYGDLVSGTYDRTATAHLEDNQYNRTDFSASVGATSTSFLVRLRRTNDFQSLDDVNGVSSNSPTLPLLFGRTNVYHDPNSQTNPNGYSPRRDGLAVRATAIADARQVLRVGSSTSGMPGVAPFAIDIAQISPAFSNPLILNPQGSTDFVAFNTAPGSVVNVGVCTLNVNVVGNQVAGSLCSLLPGNFYLPIYTSHTSVPLIVGFVYVQIDAGINLHQTSSLASGNATALVPSGFLAGVSQSDRLILQQQTQQLQGMALLAPVLVR